MVSELYLFKYCSRSRHSVYLSLWETLWFSACPRFAAQHLLCSCTQLRRKKKAQASIAYYHYIIFTVLAKVYREADVEETGVVDAAKVPSLAAKILGNNITDHETQLVQAKTEAKAGEGKK